MTIRKKIFLLAGILLALFGVVVGVLATIQKLDSDQIGNIVNYELPLSRLVAEFDVDTDRYELNILRVLRLDPASPEQLQEAVAAKQTLTDELRSDVATATTLLERAVKDPRYNAEDRVDLARIEGSFKYLSRSLEEFLALGDVTMGALAEGRREDARTASLGFAKFAQAFGPDLSEIRRAVADLTDRSTRMVLARQRLDTYLSFALFLAACGIGLGDQRGGFDPGGRRLAPARGQHSGHRVRRGLRCRWWFAPATRSASLPCPSIAWSRNCARANASRIRSASSSTRASSAG